MDCDAPASCAVARRRGKDPAATARLVEAGGPDGGGPTRAPLGYAAEAPRQKNPAHGATGLRVADASTLPTMTSGNTDAPTLMVGGKCAPPARAAA